MNNKNSTKLVEELKERHYKVRFHYKRYVQVRMNAKNLFYKLGGKFGKFDTYYSNGANFVEACGPYTLGYIKDSNHEVFENGGVTQVTIYDSEDQIVSQAEAICSLEDVFNKEMGRKISLRRAIKAANL